MKHVKCMLLAGLLCGLFGMKLYAQQETSKIDSAELKLRQDYTKREVMIPMRDGVKLFTSIYEPKDRSEKHPILMMRTETSSVSKRIFIRRTDIFWFTRIFADAIKAKVNLFRYVR